MCLSSIKNTFELLLEIFASPISYKNIQLHIYFEMFYVCLKFNQSNVILGQLIIIIIGITSTNFAIVQINFPSFEIKINAHVVILLMQLHE